MQKNLLEYMEKKVKVKCGKCGKTFSSRRALAIHISKVHLKERMPPFYKGEEISFKDLGKLVELKVKVNKQLWKAIVETAKTEGLPVEYAVLRALIDFTTLGLHKTLVKELGKLESKEYFT